MNINKDITYIHYGHNQFDIDKFLPIKNLTDFIKPKGGLWASKIDSDFGWKDWCKCEGWWPNSKISTLDDYLSKYFKFTLRENSNVVKIYSYDDLIKLSKIQRVVMEASYIIDFEKCVKNGIDAIELCWYGYEYKNTDYLHSRIDKNLHYLLYGWDCDCILIMNPNIIIPIN